MIAKRLFELRKIVEKEIKGLRSTLGGKKRV